MLYTIYALIWFCDVDEANMGIVHVIHIIALAISGIRGITNLRIFKTPRILIRIIIEVVKDLPAFLVIHLASICLIAALFEKIEQMTVHEIEDSDSYYDEFISAFKLGVISYLDEE